jgi:DNA modification methylase
MKLDLYNENSYNVLKDIESNSIDSIVTDPPYGISFMGKNWDKALPPIGIWKECIRVLKPGGYLIAMSASRTFHRLAVQIEDLGMIVHPMIAWVQGQGFPKATDLYKQFEKRYCTCHEKTKHDMRSLPDTNLPEKVPAGKTEREILQQSMSEQSIPTERVERCKPETCGQKQPCVEGREVLQGGRGELQRTDLCEMPERIPGDEKSERLHPGTQADDGETFKEASEKNRDSTSQKPQPARQSNRKSRAVPKQLRTQACGKCQKEIIGLDFEKWQGWKYGLQSLKPCVEPIGVFQKPHLKPMTKNIEAHGVGAMNIDACRVEFQNNQDKQASKTVQGQSGNQGNIYQKDQRDQKVFTPNDQGRHPANLLHDGSESVEKEFLEQCVIRTSGNFPSVQNTKSWKMSSQGKSLAPPRKTDQGSASRFFNALPITELDAPFLYCPKASKSERNAGCDDRGNFHATVKPIKLMEWLIKLVTPSGGTCLDPFMGSGTTGIACKRNGFNFVGVEREEEFFTIAEARINKT